MFRNTRIKVFVAGELCEDSHGLTVVMPSWSPKTILTRMIHHHLGWLSESSFVRLIDGIGVTMKIDDEK
jgi:hypothetical protein